MDTPIGEAFGTPIKGQAALFVDGTTGHQYLVIAPSMDALRGILTHVLKLEPEDFNLNITQEAEIRGCRPKPDCEIQIVEL